MSSNHAHRDHHFYDLPMGGTFAEKATIACFTAIAWYNVMELFVMCFTTFRRYSGLYFWSLLVATTCILPFSVAYFLIAFEIFVHYFTVTLVIIGWIGMVWGQSLVLWSRLHLMVRSRTLLRGTLAMIITTAIIFGLPASALEYAVNAIHADNVTLAFNIMERIQLVGISLQEVILSVIYAWQACRLLKLGPKDHFRGVLVQLLLVNLLMISLDAAVIAVQFANLYTIHVTLKAMAYSLKLKLEYAILGKLVDMSRMFCDNSFSDPDAPLCVRETTLGSG
ncbi:hypothetical protein HFD88_004979 [Aspergillus terreus]|nr:hypothetical protein HFD88_004979 [Aspergillus terreus]